MHFRCYRFVQFQNVRFKARSMLTCNKNLVSNMGPVLKFVTRKMTMILRKNMIGLCMS